MATDNYSEGAEKWIKEEGREGKYEIEPNKHFRVAPKGTDRYAYVGRSEVPREIKPGEEVAGKEPIVWIIKKSP